MIKYNVLDRMQKRIREDKIIYKFIEKKSAGLPLLFPIDNDIITLYILTIGMLRNEALSLALDGVEK